MAGLIAPDSRAAPAPTRASRWAMWLLWIALTVALAVAARELPWRNALLEVQRIGPAFVVAALAFNVVILPLWAAEWRLLTPGGVRVTGERMFEVVTITASVLNSVPFLVGEATAVALLISRAGLSRGAALSVLAMDQLLVGFGKLVTLGVAATAAPIPSWLRAGVLSLVAGVAALAILLVPLAHNWGAMRARMLGRPTPVRLRAARLLEWGAHFDALREPERMWRLAVLALAKKGAELAAIVALQAAFGLEPTFAHGALVLAALSVTTLLPISPANLGVYEATVFATYRYLGVPAATARAVAVVQHACFLVPMLSTGYLALTLRQFYARRPV